MLKLDIRGVNAYPLEKESITAGRVGLQILFTFSDDWKDLSKIAVFEGAERVELQLANPRCVVPEECLKAAGPSLRVGVYGIDSLGTVVTPTVWANFGQILSSAQVSLTYEPGVTPPMIAQILSAAQSAVNIANSVRSDADAGKFDGEPAKFFWCSDDTTGEEILAALQDGQLPLRVDSSGRVLVYLKQSGNAYIFAAVDGAKLEEEIRDLSGWMHETILLGTYRKPSGGIPKTDLSAEVRGELGAGRFQVVYGTTTFDQLDEAAAAGKIPVLVYEDRWYYLAKTAPDQRGDNLKIYTFTFLDTDGMLYWAQGAKRLSTGGLLWSFGSKDLGGNSI
jgi:hypothetical protein